MIPDRLQYFLDDSWNDQTCYQIWTLGPRIYHQTTWKIQENKGTSLKILFSYLRICNYEFRGRSVYLAFRWFLMFKFWNFGILKLWKFGTLEFENLKFWSFETLKSEISNQETCFLLFWALGIVRFEKWHVRNIAFSKIGNGNWWTIFKILDMNFISIKSKKWKFGNFCIFK